VVSPKWGKVAASIVPEIHWQKGYIVMVVGIIGATIAS